MVADRMSCSAALGLSEDFTIWIETHYLGENIVDMFDTTITNEYVRVAAGTWVGKTAGRSKISWKYSATNSMRFWLFSIKRIKIHIQNSMSKNSIDFLSHVLNNRCETANPCINGTAYLSILYPTRSKLQLRNDPTYRFTHFILTPNWESYELWALL